LSCKDTQSINPIYLCPKGNAACRAHSVIEGAKRRARPPGNLHFSPPPLSYPSRIYFGCFSYTPQLQICNTGCTAGSPLCQSLKKITVGAASDVSSSPASTSSDCGLDFDAAALGPLASQEPSAPEHCEALYLTTNKAGATLDDICPNGCNVSVELVDGTQVVKNLEGGSGGSSPTPNPSPDKNTSPGGSNQGGGPSPYGPTPYRRRLQNSHASLASGNGRVQLGRRL